MPSLESMADLQQGFAFHIYLIFDTAASRNFGTRREDFCNVLRRWHDRMCAFAQKEFSGGPAIRIGVLEYAKSCTWITRSGPQDLREYIRWAYNISRYRNVGAALDELDGKLRPEGYLVPGSFLQMPIIVFITGGFSTDDYNSALKRIHANRWFSKATRIGFALGKYADVEMVGDIVGDSRLVFQTEDATVLERLLYLTTTLELCRAWESFRELEPLDDLGSEVARAFVVETGIDLKAFCPLLPGRRV